MNRFLYFLFIFALFVALLIIIPRLWLTGGGLIAPAQAESNANNDPTTTTLWRRSVDRKIECLEKRVDALDRRFPPAPPPRAIEIVEPPQKD